MYLLKNKTGNAYRHAESEVKRDRLVAEGWEDVTQERAEEECPLPPDSDTTALGEEIHSVPADAATPTSESEVEGDGEPDVNPEPEQTAPPSDGDAEAEVNPEPERKGRPGRNTQAAKKADKE